MSVTPNRAIDVADGERFPSGMVGVHLAVGGDVTVELGDGSEHTFTGLAAGYHRLQAVRLVSGGPVSARFRHEDVNPAPLTPPEIPEPPPITSELLFLDARRGIDYDPSTHEVFSWETRDGAVRFGEKDEFSAFPTLVGAGQEVYVEFPGIAALEADWTVALTSPNVIGYYLVMSETPVDQYGISIDTFSAGQTAPASEMIVQRGFGAGLFRMSNGADTPLDGSVPVVPERWYVVTTQFDPTAATLRVDGVEQANGPMPAPAATGMTIGHGSVGGGTIHKHAAIAAMIVADGKPPDQERDEIEAWLGYWRDRLNGAA